MKTFRFSGEKEKLSRVLCVGAHADDIEIGCGATVLSLIASNPEMDVHWVVFSAPGEREEEARNSAGRFLEGARRAEVDVLRFRDGFFPYEGGGIKDYFEDLKERISPDLIFSHQGVDRHQDHRLISELTWNTFRDHLILEYEVPKYDGGLRDPNIFVPAREEIRDRKVDLLMEGFPSQRGKAWFTPDTFRGLMRLRGVESASPTGYAEGFLARKVVLSTDPP